VASCRCCRSRGRRTQRHAHGASPTCDCGSREIEVRDCTMLCSTVACTWNSSCHRHPLIRLARPPPSCLAAACGRWAWVTPWRRPRQGPALARMPLVRNGKACCRSGAPGTRTGGHCTPVRRKNKNTGRERVLVPVGQGFRSLSPTGTKVRRQKPPPLVLVEPSGTKGSFSPGWYYEPGLGGMPAPAPTPFSLGW
jgi:hypothetical protein